MMKRSFVGLFLAVLLMTMAPRLAEAVTAVPVLEVTGVFLGLDADKDGEFINLQVDGKTFSGTLASECRFQDSQGQAMEKETFHRSYLKRYVVVEILENTREVISCTVK